MKEEELLNILIQYGVPYEELIQEILDLHKAKLKELEEWVTYYKKKHRFDYSQSESIPINMILTKLKEL